MCNLYLMYYTESGAAGYQSCVNEQTPVITASLPEDSDVPPPKNPILEEHAKHRNAHLKKGDLESLVSSSIKAPSNRKKDLDNPEPNPSDLPQDVAASKTFEISMPGSEPKQKDDYFCTAFSIKKLTDGVQGKKVYVTGFEALASADKAHHLIVQKCTMPIKEEGEIW